MSSTFIRHTACEKCGSSDALALYSDGHEFCFSCNSRNDHRLYSTDTNVLPQETKPRHELEPIGEILELSERGLTKASSEKYRVFKPKDSFYAAGFPLFRDGVHVANKYRRSGDVKGFSISGDISKAELFGQSFFPPGSARTISVTEGYEDAMAAFEMHGSKYPCVSVHNAATARKDCAQNFEYLNSFDSIVLCFDADEGHVQPDGTTRHPGQEAAVEVAKLFPLGKVRVVTFKRHKDANDYLKAGMRKEFLEEWWAAPVWTPVGIRQANDLWDLVKTAPDYESISYPWGGLQELTYGIRLSEMVTVTANPKVGKSSFLKEIVYHILKESSHKVGLMFLEEPNRETLLGLMTLSANKPLHLPDVWSRVEEKELKHYFDEIYKDQRVIIWDHFGSNQIQKILDYVRYMHNLGCKYIILDHLSIVVSDQSGDERKQLDEISTKLKQLSIELNVAILCVIHQNRKGEIRGTAGVEQLSNIVIKLYRDMLADDPEERNIMKVSVEMNRFCGRTGPACLLQYDPGTGRLNEQTQDQLSQYMNKTRKKPISAFEEEW